MERKFNPTDVLIDGIRSTFPLEIAPWDEYFMAMAQTDFLCGQANSFSSKSYFIRKSPFNGSYALLGGLTSFLRVISDFRLDDEAVEQVLKYQGYESSFIEFLKTKGKLNLTVYSYPEGSMFFPFEPVIVLEGDLVSIRIAEGILTREVNFPTLSLTKWHRCALSAHPGKLFEFSRRRAQDPTRTSLYAHLGGADFTSNTEICRGFKIASKGTMGHEWIQSIEDEFSAFDVWLTHNPNKPVLLVDTIDTLNSGIPNAIRAFNKHKEFLKGVPGIRLDSGDLALLAIESRKMLDSQNLQDVKIFMTNDLSEYTISDIKNQIKEYCSRDQIDANIVLKTLVWAAGTMPGTCYDQPSLGGVMKLTSITKDTTEKSLIKLAKDNPIKCSIPGSNRVAWLWSKENFMCSVIYRRGDFDNSFCGFAYNLKDNLAFKLDSSYDTVEHRHICVYDSTDGVLVSPTLEDVRNTIENDTKRFSWAYKRLSNPQTAKVALSNYVCFQRNMMIYKNLLSD